MGFSATAFICVYNEADIIGSVIQHLLSQGISVHVIDNWSTDKSAGIVKSFPVSYERFPQAPSLYYSWRPLLRRVEQLALTCKSDWCIHHDADEIRRSSRKGETLLQGFERVDQEGYNAVEFKVYNFSPIDNLYREDPESYFQYYTRDHIDCRNRQVKAWKRQSVPVDISSTGGHMAQFPGCKVSPEKFILKHYALRTSEQASRKVMVERMQRYDPFERKQLGWHVQYNELAKTQYWLKQPKDLILWKD